MDIQSLELLANLAEIFGVLAVVVSLAYVGIQIRHNTRATQITAAQVHLEGYRAIAGNLVRAPGMADVFRRGLEGFSGLKDDEPMRFFAHLSMVLNFSEASYLQWKRGVLFEEQWTGVNASTTDIMAMPGAQTYWSHRRHWYSSDFQTWIDDIIRMAESNPLYPDRLSQSE